MNNEVNKTLNETLRDETMLAGRYRVVRQLGQGGMGSVWLAEDTTLDERKVAVKMLPSILVGNRKAYAQVKREALVALKLTHPNIVTVRDFKEDNGNPFLVMDYIEGQTLEDYLADRGTLSEEEAVKLLRPVAAALDYAHVQGVVHRDVKPGNVMVRRDGTPFVMDFGIAREVQETMTRVTGKLSSGTLMYMSPEQLHGAVPEPAQDVYSFAAMVYECLKGDPPFVRGQIEYQIEHDDPAPLGPQFANCGPGVMAGLAKVAKGRPPTCAAVLAAGTESEPSTGSATLAGKVDGLVRGARASEARADSDLLELKAFELSAEVENVRDALSKVSVDSKNVLADELRGFETVRRAGGDAKEHGRYAAAVQLFGRALEKAKSVMDQVSAREAAAEHERQRKLEEERRAKAEPKPGDTQTITLPGGVPMTFCWCPATTSPDWKAISGGNDFFMMGSPTDEVGRSDDEKRHPVKLTKGFWIAQTPVTQRQYEAVVGKNPTEYERGPHNPVSDVTWTDCRDFCRQLAAKLGDASKFDLPTEAQWEYACRAGTTTALNNGKDLTTRDGACPNLDAVAWYDKNSNNCKQPVKRKRCNGWNLYDMHGNVWEWCFDYYGAYSEGLQVDPTGASSGSGRVNRGGGYYNDAQFCRSAYRDDDSEGYSRYFLGFRPVRILPNQP